jgi:hypothetical protein
MNNNNNINLDKNYEELAAAIIGQAVHDYVISGHYLHNHSKSLSKTYNNHLRNYNQAKAFFKGKQFLIYANGKTGLRDYLFEKMDRLTNLGKKEVVGGKEHSITTIVLNTGVSILYQRITDAIVISS